MEIQLSFNTSLVTLIEASISQTQLIWFSIKKLYRPDICMLNIDLYMHVYSLVSGVEIYFQEWKVLNFFVS